MALTPKQEAFAYAVASGQNQSDAYRAAYSVKPGTKLESVNVAASKLMADAKVAQRVAELRKPVAKKAQITLESHLEDLIKLRNMAAKEKQYSAAISAEIARGKASGVHVEQTAQTVTMKTTLDPKKLSDAAIKELLAARDTAEQ